MRNNMRQIIQNFKTGSFYENGIELFESLGVPLNKSITEAIELSNIFDKQKSFDIIKTAYMIGQVDDSIFSKIQTEINLQTGKYDGMLIFGLELNKPHPTREELSNISRIFNQKFKYLPIVILFKYNNRLSLSSTQRLDYKIERDGDKIGKVSILRDIDIENPHRGHIEILNELQITKDIDNYEKLYSYWWRVFDLSILNEKFYNEISTWYNYAITKIKLPLKPDYFKDDKENVKNFTVRLLSRLLFVWFLKEKKLVSDDLLEITDYEFSPKKLFGNESDKDFMSQNYYYRSILQNVFFASLNTPIDSKRKYFGKKYLPR
ncbi:MAG: hypothetical protein QG567_1108, partial [Campylobacterota bacterium]|nr:hypothetical protein [Campylobacterota bacterium]